MPKIFKILACIMFVFACSEEQAPQKPLTPLVIKTGNGEVRFAVETANTPKELETGLMNRKTLDFNSGMIFNIYPVRPVAMWMKDTNIPLDMLFVGPDTSIIMIKENATPMSEELIISREPVRAVIEINAGQVAKNAIKVGDKVSHSILNSMVDIKESNAPLPQAKEAPLPQGDIPLPKLETNTVEQALSAALPQPLEPNGTPKEAAANLPQPLPLEGNSDSKAEPVVPKPVPAPLPAGLPQPLPINK